MGDVLEISPIKFPFLWGEGDGWRIGSVALAVVHSNSTTSCQSKTQPKINRKVKRENIFRLQTNKRNIGKEKPRPISAL